jgi:hypothetical protein
MSTLLRMFAMAKPGLASTPRSIPRGSLPSMSIAWAYSPVSISRLNRSSTGRSSTSTTHRTSAPTSVITRAVICVAISLTGALASSTQPVQDSRPAATIAIPVFSWSTSNVPRSARNHAHAGSGTRMRCTTPLTER